MGETKRQAACPIHPPQIWGDDDLQREDRPTGGGGPYQYVLVGNFDGNFDGMYNGGGEKHLASRWREHASIDCSIDPQRQFPGCTYVSTHVLLYRVVREEEKIFGQFFFVCIPPVLHW